MGLSGKTALSTYCSCATLFVLGIGYLCAQGIAPPESDLPQVDAGFSYQPKAFTNELAQVESGFRFQRDALAERRESDPHVLASERTDKLGRDLIPRLSPANHQDRTDRDLPRVDSAFSFDAIPAPAIAPLPSLQEDAVPTYSEERDAIFSATQRPGAEQRGDILHFKSMHEERETMPKSGPTVLAQPWWNTSEDPQSATTNSQRWELDQLIWMAVENSPLVRSVLIEPQIRQARAMATNGEFDPSTFLESIFNDTSEPVGNTLITGTAPRLNDHVWDNRSGVRKKNLRGGQAEFAQEFNFKNSNSDFFVPGNQANTKMVLRYTQPLMRGSGTAYNRSSYVVASLSADQSLQDATTQIQDHAFSITSAYWELYTAIAFRRQITRGLVSLKKLRRQLAGRSDIDSLRSQLLRAGAAIARQRSALAQAVAQISSAEATLRAAVAAPALLNNRALMIVPATDTSDWRCSVSKGHELSLALNNHPEVQALRISLKAARVRLQVAEHELRPTLDLVLEGYLRGLNGGFNATKSFGDQFSEGAPSYSAGLSYSRPYRNSAAKAILRERRLELRKTLLQLDHTLLTIGADVESAIANAEAAFTQLESTVQSTLATHAELQYLTARWQNAFLETTQTSLLLDQMLSAEIQLIQAENSWARAQADHMIAFANLRLATGTLITTY